MIWICPRHFLHIFPFESLDNIQHPSTIIHDHPDVLHRFQDSGICFSCFFSPHFNLSSLTTLPRLLVSWQSGLLNDCEFLESLVEAQQVGQDTWFQPQGCTGLTLLNAYHCTAEELTAGTQYIFRVKTSCADPRSSSSWSATSIPESTLETVQAWESNIRRLISINIASWLVVWNIF